MKDENQYVQSLISGDIRPNLDQLTRIKMHLTSANHSITISSFDKTTSLLIDGECFNGGVVSTELTSNVTATTELVIEVDIELFIIDNQFAHRILSDITSWELSK